MGDVVEFPQRGPAMMPGHAVDLRRVVQVVRRLSKAVDGPSALMWGLFDLEMAKSISGYVSYETRAHDEGTVVTVITDTVVGTCRFSILVYTENFSKK
jgi:hypothetical protein